MTQLTIEQAMVVALRQFNAGRLEQSEAIYRQIIQYLPDHPDAWNNLGIVLRGQGRLEEAIEVFSRSNSLRPDSGNVLSNLGSALREIGRLDEAIVYQHQAVALEPQSPDVFNNLATTYKSRGEYDAAIAGYRRALALAPAAADIHHHLGLTLLLKGDLALGLIEHDWRYHIPPPDQVCMQFPQPRWTGEALSGRTILLHAEQGMGDTIQFARYVPSVKQQGGKVILMCQPELKRLLASVEGVDEWLDLANPPPSFDVHCPLLSLPLAFKTTLETIPAKVPYLHAPEAAIAKWKQRIAELNGLKVGLVWSGRRQHANDRNRSIAIDQFHPLMQIENIRFISLQKEKTESLPGLIDWTAELTDFADTAGLIQNLDLVITVDTATAHLAGALGKPVWVLLPFVPDWRWMLDREDSPWYPTMRLFRQRKMNDWNDPIERVMESLRTMG